MTGLLCGLNFSYVMFNSKLALCLYLVTSYGLLRPCTVEMLLLSILVYQAGNRKLVHTIDHQLGLSRCVVLFEFYRGLNLSLLEFFFGKQ